MAKKNEDIGGVWRTIGGRRVFIKDGQDLATAMKESGKFNHLSDKAIENNIKVHHLEDKDYQKQEQIVTNKPRPIRPITSFIVFRQCDFTMQGIDAVLKVCACKSIYHCITFARDGVDGQPSLVPNIHYRRVFFAGDVIMLNKKTCIFAEVEIGLLF